MNILGYFQGIDPAACLVRDGQLAAFVEEERLVRYKHAPGMFPIRSIEFCLNQAGLKLEDVDCFAYGWDAVRYGNGEMQAFYERTNEKYAPNQATLGWQNRNLAWFTQENLRATLEREMVKSFGKQPLPPLRFYPHHKSHALTAFLFSPFSDALVLTLDGSGDHQCATVWHAERDSVRLIHEVTIPHSLGWFYAAMTEYLGFEAYDGEYKVMGLAAYGRENTSVRQALDRVVTQGPNGFDYEVDPQYIHHGPHTYSDRFTDHLAEVIDVAPRSPSSPLEPIHEEIAYETQHALERHVLRLIEHFQKDTGLKNLCMAGGVALNVKLNSTIKKSGLFDEMFIFPIPSDSGTGIGAALGIEHSESGKTPSRLNHVYIGPSYSEQQIELQLKSSGVAYRRPESVERAAAKLLSQGKVIGWFQGPMEGGPRALGGRSILADPRRVDCRDRVNSAVKFREYWRPFCPSLLADAAPQFMQESTCAPFMILAFEATDVAARAVPGVVHVDNTMRVQTVDKASNPRYHELLRAFFEMTGVPVLLNTSFNIKGEPMVCSPRDALRTFWTTGLDALAIGPFLVEKPVDPVEIDPEEVIR